MEGWMNAALFTTDCYATMTTPAPLLYDTLRTAAGLPPSSDTFLLQLHSVDWEKRQPTEQLQFCIQWSDLCQRLYSRRLTTARTIPIENVWLPWYTGSLCTDSYLLYYLGQLIALGRLHIIHVMRMLQLNHDGGDYLTRACIHRTHAQKLITQNQYVIHELYAFFERHEAVCMISLQSDAYLWQNWQLFEEQYQVLRVQCLWLYSVSGLQEIDTSTEEDPDRVLRMRQLVVNSLETIADIIAKHLLQCTDALLKKALGHILTGARIESVLCRAQHQKTLNKPRLVCTFFHLAQTEYGWRKDTTNRLYEDEACSRVKDGGLEDVIALAAAKPIPLVQPHLYLCGVKWK
jgi:hypothetical protein